MEIFLFRSVIHPHIPAFCATMFHLIPSSINMWNISAFYRLVDIDNLKNHLHKHTHTFTYKNIIIKKRTQINCTIKYSNMFKFSWFVNSTLTNQQNPIQLYVSYLIINLLFFRADKSFSIFWFLLIKNMVNLKMVFLLIFKYIIALLLMNLSKLKNEKYDLGKLTVDIVNIWS